MCHDSASGATGSRAPRTGSNCPLRPLRAVAGLSRERGGGECGSGDDRPGEEAVPMQDGGRPGHSKRNRKRIGAGSGESVAQVYLAGFCGTWIVRFCCCGWPCGEAEARRGCPLFHRAPAGFEAAHAACRFGVSMGAAPASAPARRETSASCVPVAMSSGSSRSLLATDQTGQLVCYLNRTHRVQGATGLTNALDLVESLAHAPA